MLPSDSAPLGLTAPPLPQARVPGMDGDAAAGHVPAVLCPRLHARLHRLHEPGLRLEQEGSWHCAQQLLLGLLPDSDRGRPPGGPVTASPPPTLGWRALGRGSPGEFLWGEAPRGSWSRGTRGPGVWGCTLVRALGAMGMDRLTGPCALTLGLPRRGVWHSVTPEGSSEEGWPWHLPAGSLVPQLSLAPQLLRHRPLVPSRIGGEKVILLSASAWGFITAATLLLAHLGSAHLVFMTFSRILTGLLQGRHTAGAPLTLLASDPLLQGVCACLCARVRVHTGGTLCVRMCAPVCACVWRVGSLA